MPSCRSGQLGVGVLNSEINLGPPACAWPGGFSLDMPTRGAREEGEVVALGCAWEGGRPMVSDLGREGRVRCPPRCGDEPGAFPILHLQSPGGLCLPGCQASVSVSSEMTTPRHVPCRHMWGRRSQTVCPCSVVCVSMCRTLLF